MNKTPAVRKRRESEVKNHLSEVFVKRFFVCLENFVFFVVEDLFG